MCRSHMKCLSPVYNLTPWLWVYTEKKMLLVCVEATCSRQIYTYRAMCHTVSCVCEGIVPPFVFD